MSLYASIAFVILGVLLFFVGIRLMSQTFQRWAGEKAKRLLARYTKRPYLAFFSGLIAATLLQSSSATNILVVGLASAQLVTLPNAFAVVLGSNLGTTVTAHLVAFPLHVVAPYMTIFGVLFGWPPLRRGPHVVIARLIGALGAVFYGLSLISVGSSPLLQTAVVQHVLTQAAEIPIFSVTLGALLTGLIQSSSMVTSLAVGFASTGTMPASAAIAVALGSNIGTVVTTLLASLWMNMTARRVAYADLLFNIVGVLIFLPFLKLFVAFISATATDAGRQVANAHTLFNAVTALLAFPFIQPFCLLVQRITTKTRR